MAYAIVSRATLRARLKDRYTGDPFWSDTEANDALNEAQRYFNLFTGYWRGTATANTVANITYVTVPATLTYRTRVYVAGRALQRFSVVEMYRTRRNWRTEKLNTGGDVPTTIRYWVPVGLGQVGIWPTDNVGGTTLSFDAVKLTPILTADGQFLDLGEEELAIILSEALYILAFKRPSILEAMKPKHDFFLRGCLERNDQLRSSAYFREILGLDQQQREEQVRVSNSKRQDEGAA